MTKPGFEEVKVQAISASESWDKVTGRAVARYEISDNAQTFFSFSTGYKSGGYDSLDVASSANPLEPEESTNYEWGIKGLFLDGTIRTQLSVFRLELDNRQRSVESKPPGQPSAVPTLINGDQEFDGIEVTLNWSPIDELQFGVITTYREVTSRFESYFNAIGEEVPSEVSEGETDTAYTLTFDWLPEISRGNLRVHMDYIFAETNPALDPALAAVVSDIPGFGDDRKLLNGRVTWAPDSEQYAVSLWALNLLDNERIAGVNDISTAAFGTPFVTIDPPRTYGVELEYRFR